MTTIAVGTGPTHFGDTSQTARSRSAAHTLALALVALTFASSGIVFSEPAPVDALTVGLIVLLPVIGLVRLTPMLIAYLALWLIVGAFGLIAAGFAPDAHDVTVADAVKFTAISVYLSIASFIVAGFVARRPDLHTRLILGAWTVAGVIAAIAAVVGYFALVPGAADLFTKFGRAAGTFKDPNVIGPFLTVPAVYMLHLVVTRPLQQSVLPLGVAGLLAIAILLSFSRGAWLNFALAVTAYGYLAFVTSPSLAQRERLLALLSLGVAILAGVIAVATQLESVADLLTQRASLDQSYDYGPEGRFGGQAKAVGLIVDNPLGIGSLVFGRVHHTEEVHNVYLSMMLNAGWIGGAIYWVLVALTLGLGFRHLLSTRALRPLFIVVYASFLATAVEGLVIDTDHWRHFYVLMGLLWGVMAASESGHARSIGGPARGSAGKRLVARRA
ncbi:MAG: O-antigen ligase family protein [Hyphomicrobiaceae bacterium]|nr:O-antigen ligase family protein [Hyphomicrobiaceae bacterium]